jgi:hypothetical protein
MVGRVIVATLLAAGLAMAQRGGTGGAGGSRNGEMGGMGMPRPGQPNKLDQIAEKLKLNKEQKDELATIVSGAAETAGTLNQQIANGRRMIADAIVNGKDSGDDYDKLIAAYTGVLAQMDNVEATAYGKIYALLKPNQQKNAEAVFTDLMAGMFIRSGGGGSNRKRSQ